MEARPPAENRHGGAPRGERPASWDAPRLTRADPSRLANAATTQVRLSALRPPLTSGWMRKENERTRAQQRAAGTNNTALFDIVNAATGNGSLRAPRIRTPRSRVPGERSETRDPGATRRIAASKPYCAARLWCWVPGLVPLRYIRPGHEVRARFRTRTATAIFGETNPRCSSATRRHRRRKRKLHRLRVPRVSAGGRSRRASR